MSVQPTDIAIILVSIAACIYCFVLSRRLKALQDTKEGLGATIIAMSKSISAMSATTQETRAHAGELASRLTQLLGDADKMCARIAHLNDAMGTTHASLLEEVNAAHAELSASMRDMLEDSRGRIVEMTVLMREMRSLMDDGPTGPTPAYLEGETDEPSRRKSRYSYDY